MPTLKSIPENKLLGPSASVLQKQQLRYRNTIANPSSSQILAALPLLGVSHSVTKLVDQLINPQVLNPKVVEAAGKSKRFAFITSPCILVSISRRELDECRGTSG